MNIIWLASWYPNRTDPSLGDFIERHALAVAPFLEKLTIIAVVKDTSMAANGVEVVVQQQGNVEAHIVYYGSAKWGGAADRLLSLRRNTELYQEVFDRLTAGRKLPDLLHVHVAMKAGLFAKKIKQRYQIPFIVTEHSSLFYAEAKPSLADAGWYFRYLLKSVLKAADLVLPVSDALGRAISNNLCKIDYEVLPNVVDTSIFFPAPPAKTGTLRLIHVSGMGYPKNMEAIIEAASLLQQQGFLFVLELYGPAPEQVKKLVSDAALSDSILLKGELPQHELAPAMKQADALLLYSRYETFGCVLIEANACGVPVIVSDLPVFHELVTEGVNGIFVPADDAPALAKALSEFAAAKSKFNAAEIAAETAEKFSYSTIGKKMVSIYQSIQKK